MTEELADATTRKTPSHLLFKKHDVDIDEYTDQSGQCCFCAISGRGLHVDDATSEDYFSDDPLLDTPSSDHVCIACAWVMDQRTYKQGHWLVHNDGVLTPSTGDLLDIFRNLRVGTYNPPLAVHVTSSPIRSSHSYLWTPVNETERPVTVAHDRQQVRIADWQSFSGLVAAIEDLRLHGFTFDEIRSGEPRVRNVRAIGRDAYLQRDATIDPHRRTARLELALTLSRSDDDQPRDELTDHDPLTTDAND